MTTFRVRWSAGNKQEVSELPAASAADARRAFDGYRLSGVRIISIEPVQPDASAPPVPSRSPDLPFSPLVAHRKLGEDEDAG